MEKNARSLISEYMQRTKSSRDVSFRSLSGAWEATVCVTLMQQELGTRRLLADGRRLTASAVSLTKKEAEELASREILSAIDPTNAAAVDARPTVEWDEFLTPVWNRWVFNGLAVHVGPDHLEKLLMFGSVVAIDTEGQPAKWIQLADNTQAIVLPLGDDNCRRRLEDFMRAAQHTTTFVVWDIVSERQTLPFLPESAVDAQALYSKVHTKPGGANYEKVSLARMVEHQQYRHKKRLVKPHYTFYKAFDSSDVSALTDKHIRYMLGDSLLTYYVYKRLVAELRARSEEQARC